MSSMVGFRTIEFKYATYMKDLSAKGQLIAIDKPHWFKDFQTAYVQEYESFIKEREEAATQL